MTITPNFWEGVLVAGVGLALLGVLLLLTLMLLTLTALFAKWRRARRTDQAEAKRAIFQPEAKPWRGLRPVAIEPFDSVRLAQCARFILIAPDWHFIELTAVSSGPSSMLELMKLMLPATCREPILLPSKSPGTWRILGGEVLTATPTEGGDGK
jgi:hypothetical protein